MNGRTYAAPLLCYVIGFALFPPTAFSITDEGLYVAQAVAFAHGARGIATAAALTGAVTTAPVNGYPIGTALVQAPFVYAGGWPAAAWVSVIALVVTVVALGQWLRAAKTDQSFALMFLLFAPALAFGRIAMSDMPSACLVTLALGMLWRMPKASLANAWMAGMIAVLALMFRETNGLIVAPFLAGTLLRRDGGWTHVLGGMIAGLAVRAVIWTWMYGEPLFLRDQGAGFSLDAVPGNLALYAIILTVVLPLGLVGVLAYRGPRRAELWTAFALFIGLYAVYAYSAAQNGVGQRLLLTSRFMLPLAPVIIIACAESFPRIFARAWPVVVRVLPAPLPVLASGAACLAAFAVHPAAARYTSVQADVVRDVYEATTDSAVVIENGNVAQKYINPVYGTRAVAYRTEYGPDAAARMAARAPTFIVFVDRTDTEFFREDARENARYVSRLEDRCRLVLARDRRYNDALRLRVWRVARCTSV